MVLNSVDECRQRADECRRNAAQLVTDDVLRGVYLDLARHWREMAHQVQRKEFGTDTAPSSRADRRPAIHPR
jgi:hypothetical protein